MFKKELIELRKQIGKLVGNFAEQITNDGKTLVFKGEELLINDYVYQYDDKGVMIPAEDGKYVLEDLTEITVLYGYVSAITKPAASENTPLADVSTGDTAPISGDTTGTTAMNEEFADAPIDVVPTGDTAPISGDTTDPMGEIIVLVGDLAEKIGLLNDAIATIQGNMSKVEETLGKVSKFTKDEVIVEKPTVKDETKINKMSRVERILAAI